MENQQEENLKNAEFRGKALTLLGTIQSSFDKHLAEEMEELKLFGARLEKLENWKLKVATTASVLSSLIGFIAAKLIK